MGSKRKREIPLSLSDRREEKMGSKKVTLKSSDGQVFEVEEAVALESEVIKHMIEANCANDVIPLPNVTSKILSKVIEYCEKHVEMQKQGEDNNPLDEDLKSWDADFIKVDVLTLYGLNRAADYLSIESLVDLTSRALTDRFQLVFMTREEYEMKEYEKKERRFLAIVAQNSKLSAMVAFKERAFREREEERQLLGLIYF